MLYHLRTVRSLGQIDLIGVFIVLRVSMFTIQTWNVNNKHILLVFIELFHPISMQLMMETDRYTVNSSKSDVQS